MAWVMNKGHFLRWLKQKYCIIIWERSLLKFSSIHNFFYIFLIAQMLHLFTQLISTKPFCYFFFFKAFSFLFYFLFHFSFLSFFQNFLFLSQPLNHSPFSPQLEYNVNAPKLSRAGVKIPTTIYGWWFKCFKKQIQNPCKN